MLGARALRALALAGIGWNSPSTHGCEQRGWAALPAEASGYPRGCGVTRQDVGARIDRLKRAVHVARVARRSKLFRVLREIGVVGDRPATREGAREFRHALEELGTTYIKLGQLLSSRSDLLPDVYIDELGRLVDEVPPVPFEQIQRVIEEELPADVFVRVDPEPVATASIAQIHTALLGSGQG